MHYHSKYGSSRTEQATNGKNYSQEFSEREGEAHFSKKNDYKIIRKSDK